MKIWENRLFRHRPEAIGRPVIHTHHIYMNEHIFFWMLRVQMIRICNVEMKIWGFTPSSGAFSNGLSRRKCRKNLRNFCISTFNHHRYTQFISWYMFLRMTNTEILVKQFFTYQKGLQNPWWPPILAKKSLSVWKQLICQSQYCLKQKSFTVLCVFIAKYGVNNEKSEIHGLPGFFKDVDHGKKQKAKINHFRKTAYIYHRFI